MKLLFGLLVLRVAFCSVVDWSGDLSGSASVFSSSLAHSSSLLA
jgi:hypothetical protein